ncbi:MAG TPA: peptidoglycan endopeptidase [Geobacteraceae bacterium]|nr:peptidoglycan endopeptidase [Geobacteraceae bacterium]
MIRSATAILLILAFHVSAYAADKLFAAAATHAPVLNSPDFPSVFGGRDGATLQKDSCGQLRSLEFVALPGTVFRIEEELKINGRKIFRVTTDEYPYPSRSGYFVDAGAVTVSAARPVERRKILPSMNEVISSMKKRAGTGYVWGGNVAAGVPEMTIWYPPSGSPSLSRSDRRLWQLAGVDCSGLLYEATGGYTPRNTSALLEFGAPVSVAGKNQKEIASLLQPLDLLVWPGHVMIVIDGGSIIESRLVCHEPDKGVRIRSIADTLREVMKKRNPADVIKNGGKEFVVRRWYGTTK